MDELEISGKRYISSSRAAKEHKYHADYIGQLVRGGKVNGQKVGRAWYVDAESLAEYLGKEAPVYTPVSKAEAIPEKPAEIPVEVEVVEMVEETTVSEEAEIEEEPVPLKVEEAVPLFKKASRQHVIAAIEMPAEVKEEKTKTVEQAIEEEVEMTLPKIDVVVPQEVTQESDEIYIPVKITQTPEPKAVNAAEDSFYKVSRKGLRYIANTKPQTTADVLPKVAVKIKPQTATTGIQHLGMSVSFVLLAGIATLCTVSFLSYKLYSVTTIDTAGQTSGLVFSQQ